MSEDQRKRRRGNVNKCFLFSYFRCSGLILLETYSSLDEAELEKGLPPFLGDVVNVTGKPEYSMFNLSLRDESYDAKFYKYAAHGNKQAQQQAGSLSSSSYARSNGPEDRPPSSSPLSSTASSPVSPTSDDVLLALTCGAMQRANGANGVAAKSFCSSNGSSSSSSSCTAAQENGRSRVNGGGSGATNGVKNGHAHLD